MLLNSESIGSNWKGRVTHQLSVSLKRLAHPSDLVPSKNILFIAILFCFCSLCTLRPGIRHLSSFIYIPICELKFDYYYYLGEQKRRKKLDELCGKI